MATALDTSCRPASHHHHSFYDVSMKRKEPIFVWTDISKIRAGRLTISVKFSKNQPTIKETRSFIPINDSYVSCRLNLPFCLQATEDVGEKKVHPQSSWGENIITQTFGCRVVGLPKGKQAHSVRVHILQKLESGEMLLHLALKSKVPEEIKSASSAPTSDKVDPHLGRSISDITKEFKKMDSLEDNTFTEVDETFEISWQDRCEKGENAIEIFARKKETSETKGKDVLVLASVSSIQLACEMILTEATSKCWSLTNGSKKDLKLPTSTTSQTSVKFKLGRKDNTSKASDIVATCHLPQHDRQIVIHIPTTKPGVQAGVMKAPSLMFVRRDSLGTMRRALERKMREEGPSKLFDKRFAAANFCMAVIGTDGGMLEFDDNSVRLTIPKDALTEPTVIHCHRNMDSRSSLSDEPEKSQKVTQYTPRVNCGPDGTIFKVPVELRIRHCITKEDRNDELKTKNIKVFTKEDNDAKWNNDEEESSLTIRDEWIYIKTNHFTDFFAGTDSEEEPSARADALLSTILTKNNEPNALCLYILFTGNNENQMKKYRSDMCRHISSERNWVRFGNFMDVLTAVRTTISTQTDLILNIDGEEYTVINENERTVQKKYVSNLEEFGFADQIDLGKETEGIGEQVCTLKISQNGHPNSPEPVYVKTNAMSDHQTDPLHCEEKGGDDEMSFEDLERHFSMR